MVSFLHLYNVDKESSPMDTIGIPLYHIIIRIHDTCCLIFFCVGNHCFFSNHNGMSQVVFCLTHHTCSQVLLVKVLNLANALHLALLFARQAFLRSVVYTCTPPLLVDRDPVRGPLKFIWKHLHVFSLIGYIIWVFEGIPQKFRVTMFYPLLGVSSQLVSSLQPPF